MQRAPPEKEKNMNKRKLKRSIKNTTLYVIVGVSMITAITSLYYLLRMMWTWKEFAVLMPAFLISVAVLVLFYYANDGFVDDYELWKCEDEVEELEDEDE